MSEPEDLLLEGAHRASSAALALWRRHLGDERAPGVRLVDVRARLELLVRAVVGDGPPIGVAEPPAVPNLFARAFLRIPPHLVLRAPVASTDGRVLRLPPALDVGRGDPGPALGLYRALAVGLAGRCARGTVEAAPHREGRLVRDLYLLSEAVAVDAWFVRELPGLAGDVRVARAASSGGRPAAERLTPMERRVEALILGALAAEPGAPPPGITLAAGPAASLAWARAAARTLLREVGAGGRGRRYRGLPPVTGWGLVAEPDVVGSSAGAGPPGGGDDGRPVEGLRVRTMVRRPRVRRAPEDEDDADPGMWMLQMDDPQESVEDPMGLSRPADRDTDADAGELADALSELPEARLVQAPGRAAEVLASEDPPPRGTPAAERPAAGAGTLYPEWDWRRSRYRPRHVLVRERAAPAGDGGWAAGILERHAAEVRRVRRQFERLRPHRLRLRRQWTGVDVDLGAWVTARADRRAGRAMDGRLYEDVRPARRELSILLLLDASGSTDSWVADTRRVIDVEKEALLLVCEALDALGDDYAIHAFSGEGPGEVSVLRVKSFEERDRAVLRSRIGALEPDRFTRTGAAVRHATTELAARRTRHRLLLVLSDGKPNDVDTYEGRYGVEDTRQAVHEARLEGIEVFCLTVDRRAPEYVGRIFGPTGYAVLRDATALPRVLLDAVRALLRA